MVEFLREAIAKKEEDLLCPVCLEPSKVPIFSCPDSHIICSTCVPKLKAQECPQCRVKLPETLRRDRFAEKTAREYEELLLRLTNLTGLDLHKEPEYENQRHKEDGSGQEDEGGTTGEVVAEYHETNQGRGSWRREKREIYVPQSEAAKLNSNLGLKMDSSKSLFVGNLPHNALETDIYETFSGFGQVAKVEINMDMEKLVCNSTTSIPNFGFVEFYTEESVDEVLNFQNRHNLGQRICFWTMGSGGLDHLLFVEKKKGWKNRYE